MELVRLRAERDRLETALGNLERDDDDLERVRSLTAEVEQLELELSQRRSSASGEGSMVRTEKAAGMRRAAEQQLEDLAASIRREGESHAQAYSRALETDLGRSMMRTLEDATELERGGPTRADLDRVREQFIG